MREHGTDYVYCADSGSKFHQNHRMDIRIRIYQDILALLLYNGRKQFLCLHIQAVMRSKPVGESMVLDLKTQGESVCEHLEESKRPEVQQLVKDTEQQWSAVLQAARQAELRSLSDDFDIQSQNTQSWIRDKQQMLQAMGSHTPPDQRCSTAQVC